MTLVEVIADVLQPGTTLVLISDNPDGSCERRARSLGARVVTVDLDRPEAVQRLALWRRLKRLFLLSPDLWTNVRLLKVIDDRLLSIEPQRRNILTLVRIDDPWQAEAFRAQHFSDPDSPWIAVVGIYEVTARRLLDRILASGSVVRLIIAGASPLTLALLADLARRQARNALAKEMRESLPAVTLVAETADEFRMDHQRHRGDFAMPVGTPPIEAVNAAPAVKVLSDILSGSGAEAAATAVIIVDCDVAGGSGIDRTAGIRLAGRFPATLVYAYDPNARISEDLPALVGKFRTYRLTMDLSEQQAREAWAGAEWMHEHPTPVEGGRVTRPGAPARVAVGG